MTKLPVRPWSCRSWLLLGMAALSGSLSTAAAEPVLARLEPAQVLLRGAGSSQQLLAIGDDVGRSCDLTTSVTFRSTDAAIATVDVQGRVTVVGDGKTTIIAELAGKSVECAVEVQQAKSLRPTSFELDVQPIFVSNGCSAGACHGKARGQNGFQLSLLSFDPDFDFASLTQHARGRRVFPGAPERSLILQKGAALVPHGGGVRLEPAGADYETLRRWIAEGATRRVAEEPKLIGVTLFPAQVTLRPREKHRILVTAEYSDGTRRDVTAQTAFQSNEAAIVNVDRSGLIAAGPLPGEATLMARYMSVIATCNVAIPVTGDVDASRYAALPRKNFIDGLVWEKLQSQGLLPSQPCDDATYLRRAHLDIIGRLPTPAEVRGFLADTSSDKRDKLIDALLERPEYADHWAGKWADLLRPNPYRVGIKTVMSMDQWIRDSLRANKPYDEFVREIVTAEGSTWKNGAAVVFRDRREPAELTTMISQLFLGTRLDCCKCHHHPFEKWSQDDFYSFAAYFSRVGRKGTGLSPPISGSEEVILFGKKVVVKHPTTGQEMEPRPLYGTAPAIAEGDDPRQALAAWITADDNELFVQTIANRLWAELMGRGLVEPVDDLRATNPPSNPALLGALGSHLRQQKYDLKQLIRTICTSYVYGLSVRPEGTNVQDTRNFSRRYRTRMRAEVLADAICDITGLPENYQAMPAGSRANQLWTTRIDSLTLDTFGRPDPNQDPPCERMSDGAVTQALHLMNSKTIQGKVTDDAGIANQLAKSERSPDQIIEELYMLCYGRLPDAAERDIGTQVFARPETSRRQSTEDLLWALLNTPEFFFQR
ncbi:Bacterial Ig-like domain (group 2) [Anatilimnocola aggregata]|uniref:Bacterial Ig-like domain (Group 2) n=1 Tax=Anatilimnocola aggregata TaxID=2528021 RepID=A0A517YDT0_9BACT|nr:DUF1549 domain-containing protein [Anatilimnocola aggregata]QDU28387.1 Bacterial Ig-like domain (group 2) [Anatilimnocola aggregata]